MEEILSSNDSEGDADSDEVSKEREDELYAVLHYNDFSKGVPPELLEKYCISTDKHNEFVISFKNSAEQFRPASDRDDGSKLAIERPDGVPLKDTRVARESPTDSSDDDVVIVDVEPKNSASKVSTSGDSADASVVSIHTSNSKGVDAELKLPLSRVEGLESSSKSKSAFNPKKRYWEDGAEGKSTVNKTNSENAHVQNTKLAPVTKKSKSKDDESSLTLFSKEVEPNIVPNPKKRKSTENDDVSKLPSVSNRKPENLADETKTVQNSKARALNGGEEAKSTSPLKMPTEVVVEENSDSDDSSCVVIEDPEINRKISVSSTESVVALLSSEDEVSGFSMNTTGEVCYDSEGNVSDVIEKSDFAWENVASPSSWTQNMRKYYNSSCERLRYFDHKLIRQQIKKGSREDWKISPKDLYPNNRPRQRCLVCRQTDHLARNCPKKDPTCHMCGVQGHSNVDCRNSVCLQCGRRNRQFTSVCRSCTHTLSRECFNCKQTGHESKACPEKWREFHSTTQGPLKKQKEPHNGSRTLQCCNCGKTNHTFEDCNQQHMSAFTKSLPAYNWLFGRSGSHEDWRLGFSGFSPRSTFDPPFKRRKVRHDRHSFHDEQPDWRPLPTKSKNKKNKRRKKFHNNSF